MSHDERRLEQEYAQVFASMGYDRSSAIAEARSFIAKAQAEVVRLGLNTAPNLGDAILQSEATDEALHQRLEKLRAEGVTNEDIRWWWNMPAFERVMIEMTDESNRLATMIGLIKQGDSPDAAAATVWKVHPKFGDPDYEHGSDRPLPIEFKRRTVEFIESGMRDPAGYKARIDAGSSFNAVFRATVANRVSGRWNSIREQVDAFVSQRIQTMVSESSVKRWAIAFHKSCMEVLESTFTADAGSESYNTIVATHGQQFLDRIQSPDMRDVLVFCSACCCGTISFNLLSDYSIDVYHGLLVTGSLVYNKPKAYVEEWLAFGQRERELISKGGDSFANDLGLRVCLEILMGLGLIDPEGTVTTSTLSAWAATWLKVIAKIATSTNDKLVATPPALPAKEVESTKPPSGQGYLVIAAALSAIVAAVWILPVIMQTGQRRDQSPTSVPKESNAQTVPVPPPPSTPPSPPQAPPAPSTPIPDEGEKPAPSKDRGYRTWKGNDGASIEAEFVAKDEHAVALRKIDGAITFLDGSWFSEADKPYLNNGAERGDVAPLRMWTTPPNRGQARLVAKDSDHILLRGQDNRLLFVPVDKLSLDDQIYLRPGRVTTVRSLPNYPNAFQADFDFDVGELVGRDLKIYREGKLLGTCRVLGARGQSIVANCDGFLPQIGDPVSPP